jgi:hypothetical protein
MADEATSSKQRLREVLHRGFESKDLDYKAACAWAEAENTCASRTRVRKGFAVQDREDEVRSRVEEPELRGQHADGRVTPSATESKPSPAMVITVASLKLPLVQRWTAVFPEISSSASPENVLAPIQKTTAPAMNRPAARRSGSTPMPAGAGSRTPSAERPECPAGAEENGNGKRSEDYFTTMGTGLDVDAPVTGAGLIQSPLEFRYCATSQ